MASMTSLCPLEVSEEEEKGVAAYLLGVENTRVKTRHV